MGVGPGSATLNTSGYLGVTNWRLPTVTDTGTPGCDYGFIGTDCGWNVDLSSGEMARMYYGTLGNTSYFDTNGISGASIEGAGVGSCLANDGPFSNLLPEVYWTATVNAADLGNGWVFQFEGGFQNNGATGIEFFAWAVRDGDIPVVPAPAAVWLLGSAIGALGWRRSRAKRSPFAQ